MKLAACPSRDDLAAFVLGKLPDAAWRSIADHGGQCTHCQKLLHGLDAVSDPLILQIRNRRLQAIAPELLALLQKAEGIAVQAGTSTVPPGQTLHGNVAQAAQLTQEARQVLAPPQAADEIGRLGPYRVLKLLGQGGMGMVFLAEDPKLQRTVALKVMLPSVAVNATAKERFLREARATAAIEHDHIVAIHQVDEDRGMPFLAMQLLKGMSLEDYLKKRKGEPGASATGGVTLGQILKVGREIARGLAVAHERGLIHRDIKPANIWLDATAGGRVKILDFGLARPAAADSTITQSGMIVGTPAYMAPEQATGQQIDGRADLFSLGVVLYRLCCGRLPWKGETAMGTLMAVATEDPPTVQELNPAMPPKLAELVMQLLAKKPEARPASAKAVVAAIQAIEREQAALQVKTATPVEPVPNQWQQLSQDDATAPLVTKPVRQRRRGPLVAASLLVASIAAAAVLLAAVAVFRVQTDQGTFIIETDDPEVAVMVNKAGVVVHDRTNDRKYQLKAGKHDLKTGDYEIVVSELPAGLEVSTRSFTLKKGETIRVTARIEQAVAALAPGTQRIKSFAATDKPIAQDGVKAEQGGWRIDAKAASSLSLFEVSKPGVENGMLTYRAKMKSEKLDGKAYLEMWCRLPGKGEFFSKGLANPIQGTTDWASYEIPFRLEKGQAADLLKLKLVVEGKGTVWIKDIEVRFKPFEAESAPQPKPPLRARVLKSFGPDDKPLTPLGVKVGEGGVKVDQGGWHIFSLRPRTVLLFELPNPGVENGTLTYRAQIKTDKLEGKAYPLIVCQFPKQEGKPLATGQQGKPVQGTTDWAAHETSVRLGKGEQPDVIKLDVLIDGTGTLWIKDIEVRFTPFPAGPVQAGKGVDDAWIKQAQALPADKQVAAVAAKLQELNPGFDGKVEPTIEKGVVIRCKFTTDQVTDLSPLRALYRLQYLVCDGSGAGKGILVDLSPLKGIPLRMLSCKYNKIADLSPLKDLPLTHVTAGYNDISDLSPLAGLPLEKVGCEGTKVSDLSPLKGKRLTSINCAQTPIRDLSPLRGMPLTKLECWGTGVTDLSPCQGMPLEDLSCEFIAPRDAEFLRAMPTLKMIKSQPAAEFWKQWAAKYGAFEQWVKDTQKLPPQKQVEAVLVKLKHLNPGFDGQARKVFLGDTIVAGIDLDAKHLTNLAPVRALSGLAMLDCSGTATDRAAFADLSPLVGMKLETLNVSYTQVTDLSALRGMKTLTRLYCDRTRISDLSPLAGMKLEKFHFFGPWFDDISLLKDMPLESVNCSRPEAHRAVFMAIATLKTINGKPKEEVLKEATAAEQRIKDIQKLPADAQVKEIAKWLQELNPGFDGKVGHVADKGKVVQFYLHTAAVTDISPLKALTELRRLDFAPVGTGAGKLADISPLQGLPLTWLNLGMTQVADLRPLVGMPLEQLFLFSTRVSDLSPLQGMPLIIINCNGAPVADLSPLRGTPLKQYEGPFKVERDAEVLRSIKTLEKINNKPAAEVLKAAGTAIAAFEQWIKDTLKLPAEKQVEAVAAKLKELNPGFDGKMNHKIEQGKVTEFGFLTDNVSDISPVRAFPVLNYLALMGSERGKSKLTDISPLTGLRISSLHLGLTSVADLTPLKGMPLRTLHIFLTKVTDLSPLAGMPLENMDMGGLSVADLSPLKGMPMTSLSCAWTNVADLSPLKGMKLTTLLCADSKVTDLSVLEGMPLEKLTCDFNPARDTRILKSFPALKTINGKPAAEFWKGVDAKKP